MNRIRDETTKKGSLLSQVFGFQCSVNFNLTRIIAFPAEFDWVFCVFIRSQFIVCNFIFRFCFWKFCFGWFGKPKLCRICDVNLTANCIPLSFYGRWVFFFPGLRSKLLSIFVWQTVARPNQTPHSTNYSQHSSTVGQCAIWYAQRQSQRKNND